MNTGGDRVEYSPLGNGKPISQRTHDNCVETTFERTNGLKSEYEIYVDWTNPNQIAEVSFQLPFHDWKILENSEVWKNLDEFLAGVQIEYIPKYHRDPPTVEEKVVYRNLLGRVRVYVRDKLTRQ